MARFTPIQDEIATFAARAPGRTMAEVARAVGPDRNPRDMRAAINRAARNGRVVLVPNPLFPGSFLVYAGENIGGQQEKAALRAVGRKEMYDLVLSIRSNGLQHYTPEELEQLKSLYAEEYEAIRLYFRGGRRTHLPAIQRRLAMADARASGRGGRLRRSDGPSARTSPVSNAPGGSSSSGSPMRTNHHLHPHRLQPVGLAVDEGHASATASGNTAPVVACGPAYTPTRT